MNDFQFQNTTKVYFGKDQLGHLHEEVLKHGKNVLVVYGGGSTIDASKAIAALTLTDTDDFWDLVERKYLVRMLYLLSQCLLLPQ